MSRDGEVPAESHGTPEQRFKVISAHKDGEGFRKIDNLKSFYKIGRVLGQGTFGQVRLCLHREANVICAIKIIKKSAIMDENYQKLMMEELKMLESIEHVTIMRVYELLEDA